jgi:hypothetical protein
MAEVLRWAVFLSKEHYLFFAAAARFEMFSEIRIISPLRYEAQAKLHSKDQFVPQRKHLASPLHRLFGIWSILFKEIIAVYSKKHMKYFKHHNLRKLRTIFASNN